mmetsp:Transcript_21194/g.9739  ORF Transcript_21194/g.9739 Transcript_21194/m.9739 type:complete len:225 (-) Transcript_21194:1229-1903(-)
MPKIKLSSADQDKIKAAVKKAENKTHGEITTAFIKESYDYAIYELTFAVISGFIYFVIIAFFAGDIEELLQKMFWDYSVNHLISFYGLSIFLVISACYFIANICSIDRIIVPKKLMQKKVNERAMRHFIESGVCYTKYRTGILIFISMLEHKVELLADSGINEKIPQERWNKIVAHIIEGIRHNKLADHLSQAILECGILLEQFFPIKSNDVNELSDNIELLEK